MVCRTSSSLFFLVLLFKRHNLADSVCTMQSQLGRVVDWSEKLDVVRLFSMQGQGLNTRRLRSYKGRFSIKI